MPWRRRLTWHLLIVLVIKVLLLTLLWHAFIKPNKVKVDVDTMSSRIAAPVPSFPIPTHSGGAQ